MFTAFVTAVLLGSGVAIVGKHTGRPLLRPKKNEQALPETMGALEQATTSPAVMSAAWAFVQAAQKTRLSIDSKIQFLPGGHVSVAFSPSSWVLHYHDQQYIIDQVRRAAPGIDIILVSSPTGGTSMTFTHDAHSLQLMARDRGLSSTML